MSSPDKTDPTAVLAQNQDVWSTIYEQRRQNLGPTVERVRNAEATIASDMANSHGARCAWGGELLERLKGATVLEVGGGGGEAANLMLALGAERVVTTEITPEAGELMRALGDELGFGDRLEVHIGDFFTMPLGSPHSYDIVMAKQVLHHITTVDEDRFAARLAEMLKPSGMARVMDPAVNSKTLDALRWAVPVPGRPSKLFQPAKFAEWKANDEHPERDNSTRHVLELLRRHFGRVDVMVTGAVARYHRLINSDRWHGPAMAALTRLDERIPQRVQMKLGDNHGFSAYEPR